MYGSIIFSIILIANDCFLKTLKKNKQLNKQKINLLPNKPQPFKNLLNAMPYLTYQYYISDYINLNFTIYNQLCRKYCNVTSIRFEYFVKSPFSTKVNSAAIVLKNFCTHLNVTTNAFDTLL